MQPYSLTMADERPVTTVPDVPFWSENYAFYGYDYEHRTGFLAFIGRWVKNPQLWREQLFVFLPDGTTLSHRAICPARDDGQGPGGSAMTLSCQEPGGQWRIAFDGAMQHTSFAEARQEPWIEGTPHPVVFNIEIASRFPVLMMQTGTNDNIGKYHYEQMGTCAGTFVFAGKTYRLEGYGYRDHSRGPRQLGAFDSHIWLQLRFMGSGLGFSAYHAWANVGDKLTHILDESVTIRPDGFGPASLRSSIRLSSLDSVLAPVDLDVTIGGCDYRMRGTPISTVMYSFTGDVDFFFGCAPSRALFASFDQPIEFDCNGEKVIGYMQRSYRFRK